MTQEFKGSVTRPSSHVAMSPLSFLKRAASLSARRPAVTCGGFASRCRAVASGLVRIWPHLRGSDFVGSIGAEGGALLARVPGQMNCAGMIATTVRIGHPLPPKQRRNR